MGGTREPKKATTTIVIIKLSGLLLIAAINHF
jgi:hypothetical protein